MYAPEELLEMLAEGGYLVFVNRSPVFTQKLYQELGITEAQSSPREPVIAPQRVTISVGVREMSGEEKKALWHKFVEDAEVPWRVTTQSGAYTVRQYAAGAANKLVSILRNPDIDYVKLTESTKRYYKDVEYRVTLRKYLESDMWKDEYYEYLKRGQTVSQGSNRFED